MNIIGDLGVFELIGGLFTLGLIAFIVWAFHSAIPHDMGADFTALGDKYAN